MYRSKSYLKFIRSRIAVLKGEGQTVPHHVRMFKGGGTSLKPPDSHALPVSDEAHHLLDSPGNSEKAMFDAAGYSVSDVKAMIRVNICEWLESKNIDSEKLIIDLLTEYMEENNL